MRSSYKDIFHVFFTHFEEPIAGGIGMRLERRPVQVLGGLLGSGRRRGRRDATGPTVRTPFLRFVFQVGGRSSLGHDSSFEHPVGRRHV